MSTLLVIGYPDEETADKAFDGLQGMARDLIVQVMAAATIQRDADGKYHVDTHDHPIGGSTAWGMFWGMLFGLLFFMPILGMAAGAGIGAMFGAAEKAGIKKDVLERVQAMVEPGTSALFIVVDEATPDKFVDGLKQFGGTVMQSNLTVDDEKSLQEALKG
jgi:uncharacterized membrane protein